MHQGVSYLDTRTPQIQVLAGGQIDAPQAGIAKQGGDQHFLQRFALRTHGGFDATSEMQFALEHQNPLVTEWLRPAGIIRRRLTLCSRIPTRASCCGHSSPPKMDPQAGLVARFWNLSATAQSYTVSLPNGIAAATRSTQSKPTSKPLPVNAGRLTVAIAPAQLQTVRIIPAPPQKP